MNTVDITKSEWDEFYATYNYGPSGRVSILYVYRKGPRDVDYRPWVVVAPSAMLHRIGRKGLGLYAAKNFKRDS